MTERSEGTNSADRRSVRSIERLEPVFDVPCDGCTRCCHNDAVRLLASDDLSQYQTEPHPYMPEARMLAHKPNGDCLYLGNEGCTIHATKPLMCREMDCRRITRAITWTQARKMEARGALRMDIWRRGKELLCMGSNEFNEEFVALAKNRARSMMENPR